MRSLVFEDYLLCVDDVKDALHPEARQKDQRLL